MTQEQKDALETVEKINDELYEKYCVNGGDCESSPILTITIADFMFFINLSIPSEMDIPEFHIYNSEDDDRIYYEEDDEYESFYHFIKRKFETIKCEINKIEL